MNTVPGQKTNHFTRTITVSKNVLTLLKAHRKSQNKQKLAAGKAWANKWDLVFTEADGSPMDRRNLTNRFGNLAKNLGHDDFTFHGLRHTHATILLSDGEFINVVSERLEHADIDTTLKTYGHVLPKKREDVADRFHQLVPSDK